MCVMRVNHHVVDIAAYEDAATSPIAALRVYDRALVLHRWHGAEKARPTPDVPVENVNPMTAAKAERTIASLAGRLPFRQRSTEVRDLRSGDEPSGSFLTWREPLDVPTLRRVEAYVHNNPDVSVRLGAGAMRQLRDLRTWPLRRLRIDGEPHAARIEAVRELHLESAMNFSALAEAFPNLSALRISARGATFDAKSFSGAKLGKLDLSGLKCVTNLGELPHLHALRLVRTMNEPDLGGLNLRTLAVDDVALRSLEAVTSMRELEELELRALWQLQIADASPLAALPKLVRGWVDIGGRRKNIEVYRRVRWAYPWPFEYAPTTATAT